MAFSVVVVGSVIIWFGVVVGVATFVVMGVVWCFGVPVSCVLVFSVIVACVFVSVIAVVVVVVWFVVFADDDGFVVSMRVVVNAFVVGLGIGFV